MKTEIFVSALVSLALVAARPVNHKITKREVPQEHSHNAILAVVRTSLNTNNPAAIKDPVFGLLGNAGAAGGAGSITDTECLQQATADQAFTNAKAANDVAGMTAALQYRALERNTGQVGLQSNSCTSIQATNPQIAAIQQHQDPASNGAAATNKAIVLALAQQIASVGGDPTQAIATGTFAPGQIGDPTARGNACDDENDTQGCIVSQNLLVPDATVDEINAAVAGGAGATGGAGSNSTATAGNSTAAASSAAPPFSNSSSTSTNSSSSSTSSNSTSTSTTGATGALNLGDPSCSDPAIAFGNGFDNRKEPSFEPDDKATFQHGSADNPGIVANFICDRLNDQCKAAAATVSACRTAASAINGKNGDASAADQFNAALGVTASKVGVDEAASTAAAAAGAAASASSGSAGSVGSSSSTSSSGSSAGSSSSSTAGSNDAGSSGSNAGNAGALTGSVVGGCSAVAPPAGNAGSSGANTGSTSSSSSSSSNSNSGSTSSTSQQGSGPGNDSDSGSKNGKGKGQGHKGKGGKGSNNGSGAGFSNSTSTSTSSSSNNSTSSSSNASNSTSSSSSSNASNSTSSSSANAGASGSATDFGSCSNPTIAFAPAADRGNVAAFQPANAADFNHGSALNIQVISSFICSQLQNKCKASDAAVSACQQGAQASNGQSGQAGADTFNRALGA